MRGRSARVRSSTQGPNIDFIHSYTMYTRSGKMSDVPTEVQEEITERNPAMKRKKKDAGGQLTSRGRKISRVDLDNNSDGR